MTFQARGFQGLPGEIVDFTDKQNDDSPCPQETMDGKGGCLPDFLLKVQDNIGVRMQRHQDANIALQHEALTILRAVQQRVVAIEAVVEDHGFISSNRKSVASVARRNPTDPLEGLSDHGSSLASKRVSLSRGLGVRASLKGVAGSARPSLARAFSQDPGRVSLIDLSAESGSPKLALAPPAEETVTTLTVLPSSSPQPPNDHLDDVLPPSSALPKARFAEDALQTDAGREMCGSESQDSTGARSDQLQKRGTVTRGKTGFIHQRMFRSETTKTRHTGPEDGNSRRQEEKEYIPLLTRFVKHPLFDIASGLLILANTVVIGCETDFLARNGGLTNSTYSNIRTGFFCFFLVELFIRIAASGRNFLCDSSDRAWNIFDTVMVTSSVFEVCFEFMDTGGATQNGRVLRMLRIVRITRAMRIGRILRYARTFRQIAYALQSSMGTLFWVMVMIFLIVYCFAICFCQASTDYIAEFDPEQPLPAHAQELSILYENLPRSLYSLYLAMTGGKNWGEVIRPLMTVSWTYSCLFFFFISFTYFGVLNIVTAIFVDSAMQSQQNYKDLLIQESTLKKQQYHQHLREVFKQIDGDDSGHINGDEMEFFLEDPALNQYLESVDIFPNDARALFRLLDRNDDGKVGIDEFCEGCLRLKGEAKSFDIHCMIYNSELVYTKLKGIIDHLEDSHPRLEEAELSSSPPKAFGLASPLA